MARPLRIEFPGAFYHITSRGNERKEIFRSRADREKFLSYLESAIDRYGVTVHVYCLMTNHYHLLLETPRGNLSHFMRYLNGAYTTYFNVKRKRSGHLFQGRYKAIVVDADEYAIELSRYIHLNPVRAHLVAKPQEHEWSSYRSYSGISVAPTWLSRQLILSAFGMKEKKYKEFVEDLLGTETQNPFAAVVASTLLGSPEFVAEIAEGHVKGRKNLQGVPSARALVEGVSVEDIIRKTEEIVAGTELARKIAIHLCHRYGGGNLKTIGARFGICDSAVSQASKRFAAKAENDVEVMRMVEKVRLELNL